MSRVSRERNGRRDRGRGRGRGRNRRRGQSFYVCPFHRDAGRWPSEARIINEICYRPDIYTRAIESRVEKEDQDGRRGRKLARRAFISLSLSLFCPPIAQRTTVIFQYPVVTLIRRFLTAPLLFPLSFFLFLFSFFQRFKGGSRFEAGEHNSISRKEGEDRREKSVDLIGRENGNTVSRPPSGHQSVLKSEI